MAIGKTSPTMLGTGGSVKSCRIINLSENIGLPWPVATSLQDIFRLKHRFCDKPFGHARSVREGTLLQINHTYEYGSLDIFCGYSVLMLVDYT